MMKTFDFAFIAKMRPVDSINHENPTKTDLKTLDYLQSLTDFIINLDPKKEPRNINTKGGDPDPTPEQKKFYSELKNNKELLEALCVYIPKAQTYVMGDYSGMEKRFYDFGVKNYPPYTSLDFSYIYYGIVQVLWYTREAYLIYFNEKLQRKIKQLELQKEKLHKQPRALLKTVSKHISKTTGEASLFSIQNIDKDTPVVKEEISRVASALAFLLMQLYQENKNEPIEIHNLTAISETLGCKNERLKIYLLYLGGYTYPIIDKNELTKGFSITNEQMFTIVFHYGEKVAKKYHIENNEIKGADRIGTSLMNFIKNEPVESIIITPNPRFISALQGKGLGNILTVNDKFVGLILELTDIATKILTYSSSNRQNHTIEEDKLIAHLGLHKQLINQSRPRVRETILKGLEELKTKRHIKSYSFNEITRMYKYTVSEEYVRHKEKSPKED